MKIYNTLSNDFTIIPNGTGTQDLCACADQDIVSQGGMALSGILSGSENGDADAAHRAVGAENQPNGKEERI